MSRADAGIQVESLTFLVAVDDAYDVTGGDKGIFSRSPETGASLREIPLSVLRENFDKTIEGLRSLFDASPPPKEGFALQQIEVSFEVTASGKIALMGTGAEVAGKGAITLTFGK